MKLQPELLLHPNIPKPLHTVAPRDILGQTWWNRERVKAYNKNDNHCFACGVHKTVAKYHNWLEAHESYHIDYTKGELVLKEIVALCHSCHNYIHDGRMSMLLKDGKMSEKKYDDIIGHGERVLREAGYKKFRPKSPEGPIAKWGEWHLLLNGTKYYSPFKDYEDWKAFWQKPKAGEEDYFGSVG